VSDEKQVKNKAGRVVSFFPTAAIDIGTTRSFVSLTAEWTKHIGMDIEHVGGLTVRVRWNTRSPQGTFRNEALVHCNQINFEPVPQ